MNIPIAQIFLSLMLLGETHTEPLQDPASDRTFRVRADLVAPDPSAPAKSFVRRDAIDKIIDRYSAKGFIGQVAISSAHETIYLRSEGTTTKNGAPYSAKTAVDIASVSKQFTATALMKLVQAKKLALSDRLDQHFEHVPTKKSGITLHQLLTHTAGLKRHMGKDSDFIKKAAAVNLALSLPLAYAPGTKYHYSDIGYVLLAAIIENTSGQRYEDYLHETLFKPTALKETGFADTLKGNHDIPMIEDAFEGFVSPLQLLEASDGNFWRFKGAGGILSTSEDMMKWHRALLNGSPISLAMQELMVTPHTPEEEEGYFYGYGWSIKLEEGSSPIIWHNGRSFFNTVEFWRLPESGMSIFVTSHTGPVAPYWVAQDITAAIKNQQ